MLSARQAIYLSVCLCLSQGNMEKNDISSLKKRNLATVEFFWTVHNTAREPSSSLIYLCTLRCYCCIQQMMKQALMHLRMS